MFVFDTRYALCSANPLPFEYTEQHYDQNGLQYHRARYYDPSLGVWASVDPLEVGNRYGYVGGDPVNRVDGSGLFAQSNIYGGWMAIPGGAKPANELVNAGCGGVGIPMPLDGGQYLPILPSLFSRRGAAFPGFGGLAQQQGADEGCVTGVNGASIEPLGALETTLFALSGLKLTVTCGSGLSWHPYLGSVQQAIRDVEARMGSFRSIFGNLEFRLARTSPGSHAAETFEPTLVVWYNNVFSGSGIGGGTPIENRTFNIVHELGHVLANRTGTNTPLYNDALSATGNDLLPLASLTSTTMQPQNTILPNSHIEKTSELFLFWIYGAINSQTDESNAGRAFAEGGLIVRQFVTGNYVFVHVGLDYTPDTLAQAESMPRNDPNLFFGATEGFNYWINAARSQNYSLNPG